MDTAHPFIEGSRGAEAALIDWARSCGVPAPEVLWGSDDSTVLGGAFFIMARVPGESRVQRLHRDPRYAATKAELVPQAAKALATIHRMKPTDAPPGVILPQRPPARDLADLEALYRRWAVEPHPVLETAFRTLEQWKAPPFPMESPMTVVHGDFRPGNLLFDEEGLSAVLDWELAQFGDPHLDLAWFCLRSWRGGHDDAEAGGLASRDEWLSAYADAGGRLPDAGRWRFWNLFAHLRWAVVTVKEMGGYLGGLRNIELAGLGRRTAEVEWDLLTLLEREG